MSDDKIKSVEEVNESMILPPGVVDYKQVEGHAMVLALKETIESCIVTKAKYFVPELYRTCVFGNEKIQRIILQNLASLHNIFKYYSDLTPAEISAELGQDIVVKTSDKASPTSPSHNGSHERMSFLSFFLSVSVTHTHRHTQTYSNTGTMGIENVRILMQHCSGGGASVSEMRNRYVGKIFQLNKGRSVGVFLRRRSQGQCSSGGGLC